MSPKHMLWVAICAGFALPGWAQDTTTQQSVVGPSGDAVYSDQILGTDGETYFCRPGLIPRGDQLVRRCRRVTGTGAANAQLAGGALSAPAALAAVAVLVVVAGGSSSSTTATD
ncbi:hypothetical protein GCM10007385_34560 [Tateyamaria omphalii]|uniref:hypothetical protein n=1 Tax=Tateyamaria omphalii TaxID=299262 RepID=UPI0016724CAA|nr:hypothetical protein [Tateyamaria omphalii]GGX62515.1 hypothetical protein GCM10007385_34560 [Tateyamaria omphalii]